jgi:branched-chain amino acid transport system permease protein
MSVASLLAVVTTRNSSATPYLATFGAIVFLAVMPFFIYPIFLVKVLCFGLFAAAFNLLLGYGGLLSFGHAAYFGIASYVAAYTVKFWALTPELAILAGMTVAGVLGLLFGAIAIKRQGIYFAMITLALSQLVYFFCLQADFTGGEDGIQNVPRGLVFGVIPLSNDFGLYGFVATVCVLGLLAIYRIIHSPFGQVLKAIRDNEPRAISLGYRTDRYKLILFVFSTTLSGLAGALKAVAYQLASLTDVHWATSGDVVLMSLLGGAGTFLGPVVGAAVMVGMETYLAQIGGWLGVIKGVIFIFCIVAFSGGILGVLRRRSSTEF